MRTLHTPLLGAATAANLTGARSRDTLVPERSAPASVPLATTPAAVARKLVIFADNESLDDGMLLLGELAVATAVGSHEPPLPTAPTTRVGRSGGVRIALPTP